MLEREKLEFPFNKRPEEGPLKTLPTYLRPFGYMSGGARGPPSRGRPEGAARQPKETKREDEIVNIASAAVDVLHEHNRSRSVASTMETTSGFRYDAEIQLGASRERCLELEIQVNSKNDEIARLERQLVLAKRAREKDAQRFKSKIKSLKDTYTRNLGEIIKRYTLHLKTKRARAGVPAGAPAFPASASRQPAPPGRSEETNHEFYLDFLEKFKSQMEVLKRNLLEEERGL